MLLSLVWNMFSSEITSASKCSIRFGRWTFRTNHFKICKLHLSQMTQSTRRSSHMFPCLVSNFPTNNRFKKLQIFHNNVVHNPWLASRPKTFCCQCFSFFQSFFLHITDDRLCLWILDFGFIKLTFIGFFREKTMKVLKESFTTHSTEIILSVQCLSCVKWTLAKFPTITEYCNVYAGTWLVRWNERNHWIICSRMSWKQIFDCSTSFNVFYSWHELKFPRDKFLMKNRHA